MQVHLPPGLPRHLPCLNSSQRLPPTVIIWLIYLFTCLRSVSPMMMPGALYIFHSPGSGEVLGTEQVLVKYFNILLFV